MLTSVVGAASPLGFETNYHEVMSGDVAGTLTAILQDQPDVLFVIPDIFLYTHRRQIIDFTLTNRIPALYGLKEYVPEGGLMALGPNREEVFRRAAEIVDKILKGANPADIPVEQPTKFELLINLKTAKALGLVIPDYLITIADEVINDRAARVHIAPRRRGGRVAARDAGAAAHDTSGRLSQRRVA
jgi:putative ABC transport system substrate-binding protein